ncbi:MAG TPA: MMPL family transporter [Streptosporangiaceae bacterium]|nr:MMPL family transporter [Streptosporangiaceae bacterium]
MRLNAVFGALGSFVVKFRWVVLLVWVVAAVAIPRALPSLASVTQGNNTSFLPASAPSEHAAKLAAPFGSTNLTPVPVVAAVSHGQLTSADVAYLSALPAHLRTVPTVVQARLLGRSADGQAAQLQVLSTAGGGNQAALKTLIDGLRSQIARAGPPPGLSVHLAGSVAIQVDQQTKSGTTGNQVQDLSVVFILLLLLVIFRSLLAPFITLIPAFLSVLIAGPLVAEAAHHGLKVSQLSQLMLIVLVLGAGTDYGLFLVFRVRENLRHGEPPKDAVRAALVRVGESITFSAATVVAALLSLLFATFQIYSNLGIPLAIGIGVMLLAGLTLLPALLAIFGRAAFWPSKIGAGTGTTGVWGRIAGRIIKRPAIALGTGVIVFGGLAIAVFGYSPGGFGGSISAPKGTDSAAGTALLAKHFPASSANPTDLVYRLGRPVWDNPAALASAQRHLVASGLFTGVTGPLNPSGGTLSPAQFTKLHAILGPAARLPAAPPAHLTVPAAAYQVYRGTAQYVSPNGLTVQYQAGLKAGEPSTTAAMKAVPAVRAEASTVARQLGATDFGVGGEAPGFYDVSQISDSDLVTVIPIAIVVIGVLLALVLRSLVAPLYLIVSVGLSYLAALGLSVLLFIDLGGSSGLTFILPFLMFIFLLALGEDYNILLMTRIREEAHNYPLREAVQRAVGVTGTTVTSAGLVLAGTFSVFALVGGRGSGGSEIRDVGIGLAVGVLMDTFVVRTVLVPATVVLLGRWNWWPSRLSRVSPLQPAGTGAGGGFVDGGSGGPPDGRGPDGNGGSPGRSQDQPEREALPER